MENRVGEADCWETIASKKLCGKSPCARQAPNDQCSANKTRNKPATGEKGSLNNLRETEKNGWLERGRASSPKLKLHSPQFQLFVLEQLLIGLFLISS